MARNPPLTPNMPQSVPMLVRSPLVSQQNVMISPNHTMGQPMVVQVSMQALYIATVQND